MVSPTLDRLLSSPEHRSNLTPTELIQIQQEIKFAAVKKNVSVLQKLSDLKNDPALPALVQPGFSDLLGLTADAKHGKIILPVLKAALSAGKDEEASKKDDSADTNVNNGSGGGGFTKGSSNAAGVKAGSSAAGAGEKKTWAAELTLEEFNAQKKAKAEAAKAKAEAAKAAKESAKKGREGDIGDLFFRRNYNTIVIEGE